jgi:hypothetical protein
VQRLRVRYAKRGRLRFTSHRDISRAVERAVRRAGIPVAYSAGFSPHPKISYAGAAPTGVASEAEYLEIGVTTPCDPEQVRSGLDESLPPGLDVLDVVEAGQGGLADRLEVSDWEVRLPGADRELAEVAAEKFLILRMVIRHMTPAVRPDDVLTGLRLVADFAPPVPPEVTRLAQGPLDASTGALADPLDLDRDITRGGEAGPAGEHDVG